MYVIWNKTKDRYWSAESKNWFSFYKATIYDSKDDMPDKMNLIGGNKMEEIFILEIFD